MLSHDSILLESREEQLAIKSRSGLFLPSIDQDDEDPLRRLNQSADVTDIYLEAPVRYNLCINREDGSIFRATVNCPYLVS